MRYQEEVRRGAALLDEKEPGWRDRIAPAELEMSRCNRCVVGQVLGLGINSAGPYWDILQSWFPGEREDEHEILAEITHGFSIPLGGLRAERENAWRQLRDAWIGYIKGEWS